MNNMPTLLPLRDGFAVWQHVAADLLFDGPCAVQPRVTIGIPTFKRPHLLVEAVRSALAQSFDQSFELIIVDNDPDSEGMEHLLAAVPEARGRCVRYFRNRENVGLFGNWNQCIKLARGEWVTVLNDDDLLDTNYLELMFTELAQQPKADGIVCRKRTFDQRSGANALVPDGSSPQHSSRRINFGSLLRLLARGPAAWGTLANTIFQRLNHELVFSGKLSRRVFPRTLFFGSLLGNGGGFLFKREAAVQIGGYYPNEFPAADYWFYTRFAKLHHLREHRATAASIRIAENESAKPDTVKGCFYTGYAIQHALAKEDVPRWWLRFSPLILAMHRGYHRDEWKVAMSDAEVYGLTGMRLPEEKPRLLNALRFLFRWY
jgi:glycosyltransferase involved in cell wall biosynthesis